MDESATDTREFVGVPGSMYRAAPLVPAVHSEKRQLFTATYHIGRLNYTAYSYSAYLQTLEGVVGTPRMCRLVRPAE